LLFSFVVPPLATGTIAYLLMIIFTISGVLIPIGLYKCFVTIFFVVEVVNCGVSSGVLGLRCC
jgi:hypothetical protein